MSSADQKFRQAVIDEQPLQCADVAAGSCGIPDLGITTMEDVLIDLRRIRAVTDLPLLVDIDTGWGWCL